MATPSTSTQPMQCRSATAGCPHVVVKSAGPWSLHFVMPEHHGLQSSRRSSAMSSPRQAGVVVTSPLHTNMIS
uniref:Uncharacterized protein n=1 Tax=Oryza glumipatula TaxID=40148 RepID=A0A0D9YWZ5_9ORYZ